MKDEIVAGLIKDLGSRLSAMSEEFNANAERLLDARAEDDDGVISTPVLLSEISMRRRSAGSLTRSISLSL